MKNGRKWWEHWSGQAAITVLLLILLEWVIDPLVAALPLPDSPWVVAVLWIAIIGMWIYLIRESRSRGNGEDEGLAR